MRTRKVKVRREETKSETSLGPDEGDPGSPCEDRTFILSERKATGYSEQRLTYMDEACSSCYDEPGLREADVEAGRPARKALQ